VAAAPAIGYLALGLLALLSLMAAMGTQAGYRYTFGMLFVKLAETFEKVRLPTLFHSFQPLKSLAVGCRWLNHNVYALIGAWIAVSEKGVAYFFTALAQLSNWLAHEIAQLAKATFRMGRGIIVRVERMVRDLIRHYVRPLVRAMIRTAVKPIRALIELALRRIKALSHLARAALLSAVGAARFLRHLLLARLLRLQRLLTKRIAALAHRIWTAARLRKLIQAMLRAIAWDARVLRALGRLGLGWLRATNVVRFGKFLMRQGLDWIDGILALISPVAGTMSIREFARLMIEAVEPIEEATTRFWEAD
jgi:signal transduction histidine kinase